jgi:O-acetyl-ADP-ribose deacetylase (regulator of RNase III)
MGLTYHKGDASIRHDKDKLTYILHVVNNVGAWGAGFTRSLERRYPGAGHVYRHWCCGDSIFVTGLGGVYIDFDRDIVHLMAQDGVGTDKRRINYAALGKCLLSLATNLSFSSRSHPQNTILQMPKIGTGLAGGDWNIIKVIIEDALEGWDVRIYEF